MTDKINKNGNFEKLLKQFNEKQQNRKLEVEVVILQE
jgi:multimeric flavodoxin WrbA